MSYKKIGIIGGVGPSATTLYYTQIIEGIQKRAGGEHYPEIVIYSLDMGEIGALFENKELDILGEKLIKSVNGLNEMACDFVIIACNGMHILFDKVQEHVSIPMISIIESVMKEVKYYDFTRVGLLGTTIAMRGSLYRAPLETLGVECLVPDDSEQEWIMEAIRFDLQLPEIPGDTVNRLMNNVKRLQERGAEAIILACTDLSVAIKAKNTEAVLIDSTKIHVKAVLDNVLGEKEPIKKSQML